MEYQNIKILKASAGSGKTYRLAYDYIKLLIVNPSNYAHILAVTFTNKATEEMKSRILLKLNNIALAKQNEKVEYINDLINDTKLSFFQIKHNALQARTNILHDYSNFAISTIDKFFQKITRSFFKELNLDFSYEVELNSDSYITKAVDKLIENSYDNTNIQKLIESVVGESIDNNIWDISKAMTNIAKTITKESYIKPTKKPAELSATLEHAKLILNDKLSLLKLKANEALNIIDNANLSASDFFMSSKSFVSHIEKISNNIIKPYNSYYTKALMSYENWYGKTTKISNKNAMLSIAPILMPYLESIATLTDQYIRVQNSITAIDKNFSKFILLDYISTELERLWGENNRLPLHRSTALIAEITQNTPASFIYEKIGARYQYYMIDEFQDTSQNQWRGFVPLLEESISKTNEQSVLIIGDVKQAIYRWRGGSWNILANEVIKQFPGRVDDTEKLSVNYRSLKNIVEFNNKLLNEIVITTHEKLSQNNNPYKQLIQTAYNQFEQQPKPLNDGGYIECRITDDFNQNILDTINKIICEQKYQPKDIAILCRSKKTGKTIATELLSNNYDVVSDEALLINSSKTIKFIISIFNIAYNINSDLNTVYFNHYLSNDILNPLENKTTFFIKNIIFNTPTDALEKIIKFFNLQNSDTTYIQAFYQVLHSFATSKSCDMSLFLEWWEERKEALSINLPEDQNAITVLTIHKSKGLQYPIIIIPVDWGLIPRGTELIWAKTDEEPLAGIDDILVPNSKELLQNSLFEQPYNQEQVAAIIDNINLLYVAITRSEKELYLMWEPNTTSSKIASIMNEAITSIDGLQSYEDNTLFCCGERTIATQHTLSATNIITLNSFQSYDTKQRIASRLPHHRQEEFNLTQQHFGLIMHSIFSKINNKTEALNQIQLMNSNGDITNEKTSKLSLYIEQAFNNTTIASWFNDNVEVFNERAILVPQINTIKRPDRVIINNNKITIIDYKFGKNKTTQHQKQIKEYRDILFNMGYEDIECYLWYIMQEEVVFVS